MKKTAFIDIITTIKQSFVAFLSILMFVNLAVALFSGMTWADEAIKLGIDNTVEAGTFHDLILTFPYGFTEEDLSKLNEIEGVDEIEGSRTVYQIFSTANGKVLIDVSQINSTIDTFSKIDGKVPEKEGEIAVQVDTAERLNLQIGDKICFKNEDSNSARQLIKLIDFNVEKDDLMQFQDDGTENSKMEYLKTDTFVITAIVEHPNCYIKNESMYGDSPTNSMPIGGYMYVAEESFDMGAYDGYTDVLIRSHSLRGLSSFSDDYENGVEALKTRVQSVVDQIVQTKNDSIVAKRDEIISSGESKIKDAENKALDAKEEIAKKELELQSFIEMTENDGNLPDEINEQILIGQKNLKDAKTQLEDEYANIEKGKEELSDFENQSDSIKKRDCFYSTKNSSVGILVGNTVAKIFMQIRTSLAGLFVIIGLLVCYFAILRLVNDQIHLIGTQKALGFRESEIARKYMFFTGLAVIIGCATGLLTGKYLIERAVCSSVSNFRLQGFSLIFDMTSVSIIIVIEIVLLILITYIAAKGMLRKNAIVLLNGEQLSAGKLRFYERFGGWKKLSLLSKTIINNFFNEKRRVIGTFVGIMGSAALLVTAFSINENVMTSFKVQFQDYFHFDTIVIYDTEDEGLRESVCDVLDKDGIAYVEVMRKYSVIDLPDGSSTVSYITVPKDREVFDKMVTLEPAYQESDNVNKGVWVNAAYKNYFGNKVKDTMGVAIFGEAKKEVPITGYYEYYLTGYEIFMDQDTYKSVFGETPTFNAFLVDRAGMEFKILNGEIDGIGKNAFCTDYYEQRRLSFNMFQKVSKTMILVYTIVSVLMAVLVLLNLLTMFIEEKKNELIILMINGFEVKDVKKYISRDTVILTILGILGGLGLGSIIGDLATKGFDTPLSYYVKQIEPRAMLIGVIGTAVLSFIMCRIALMRINRFKLSDIMK